MTSARAGNSRIFYRGPSQIDGAPILGIITGLDVPSTNTKTGDMLQTYILREDVSPPDAVKQGLDRSICGDCALRGDGTGLGRSCYVQLKWAPLAVWKYAQREKDLDVVFQRGEIEGRFLRMGTYGDPCAIPIEVWQRFLRWVTGWTGYTHQWRDPRFTAYRYFCMASVESRIERSEAVARGWRTFRVRQAEDLLSVNEITCPASAEAGHRTTCAQCRLCNGRAAASIDERADITILAHGTRAAKFDRPLLPFEED